MKDTLYIGLKSIREALAQYQSTLSKLEREALQILREEAAAQGRSLRITRKHLAAKVAELQALAETKKRKEERKATLQRFNAERKALQQKFEEQRKAQREILDAARKQQAEAQQQAEAARIERVAEIRTTAQIARMGERLAHLRLAKTAAQEAYEAAYVRLIEAATLDEQKVIIDQLLVEEAAKQHYTQRIAKLEAILNKIVEGTDRAKAELAKGVLTAKPHVEQDPEEAAGTGRWSYSVLVAKPQNFLPESLFDALNGMKSLFKKGAKRAKGPQIAEALAIVEAAIKADDGKWSCDSSILEQRKLSQSELAEIFGIEPNRLTRQLAIVEHDFWSYFDGAYNSKALEGHEELRERFRLACRALLDKLAKHGVDAYYGPQVLHLKPFVANASALKKGIVVAAERGALARNMKFLTFGQNLTKLTKISGQDLFKALALTMTPSKPFTWGAENRKVTADDVIIVKKMTVRIPVKDATLVGEGERTVMVPVQGQDQPLSVKLAVKKVDETEVSLEAFDGMLLGNLPGVKRAVQVRGMGLKGLALLIDVALLLRRLPDLADQAEDGLLVVNIDGEEERMTKGRVVGTTSVFKAKAFFADEEKPLAKWRSNIKALREEANSRGEFVAEYGCLREASASEDELTTDRQTSRQMLQQILSLGFEDALMDEMVSDTISKAVKLRTFSGSFRRMARFGKEATPMAELAKLVPELAAAPWLKAEALSSMLTTLADAASGRLNSVGVNALVTCDPAAFLRALAAQRETGCEDVTDVAKSEVEVGKVHLEQLRAGVKAVVIRYPASDSSIDVYVVVHVDIYAGLLPETVAVINPTDPLLIRADMDVDGDHLQFHIHMGLVAAAETALRIFSWLGMGTTVFEHGEGVKKGPYSPDFIREGMVDAMLNGQQFNLVGPFSNLATRFWAMLGVMLRFIKQHDGEIQTKAIERARDIAASIKLASTAAILCIDWCKTGVPKAGTVGRKIFDAASALRKWAPKMCHGKMPWSQCFADDSAEERFWEAAAGTEKVNAFGASYTTWRYGEPDACLMDQIGQLCLEKAGITVNREGDVDVSTITFDDEGVTFDPALIGYDPDAKGAGKGYVHCRAIARLNPANFEEAGDRAVVEAAKKGTKVGFTDVAYFLYHQRAAMEKSLAAQFEKADEGDIVADTRREYLRAARAILLGMTGFQWKDGDANDDEYRYSVLVNTAIGLFLKPGIASNEANTRRKNEIRAKFARWILLEVFAPDVLLRVYARLGAEIPDWVLEATDIPEEKEVNDALVGGDFDEDLYLPSEEEQEAYWASLA